MRAPARTIRLAKGLRSDMSPPERILWSRLRRLRLQGVHIRRQHPLGPYVLDFFCARAAMAIEVDGVGHRMGDRPARDERRDAWLAERGVRVVRFPATEVLSAPDDVARAVFTMAREQTDFPPPLAGEVA